MRAPRATIQIGTCIARWFSLYSFHAYRALEAMLEVSKFVCCYCFCCCCHRVTLSTDKKQRTHDPRQQQQQHVPKSVPCHGSRKQTPHRHTHTQAHREKHMCVCVGKNKLVFKCVVRLFICFLFILIPNT